MNLKEYMRTDAGYLPGYQVAQEGAHSSYGALGRSNNVFHQLRSQSLRTTASERGGVSVEANKDTSEIVCKADNFRLPIHKLSQK